MKQCLEKILNFPSIYLWLSITSICFAKNVLLSNVNALDNFEMENHLIVRRNAVNISFIAENSTETTLNSTESAKMKLSKVIEPDPSSLILDFWRKQESKFKLNDAKDVILVMGNTGSGKSTIVSALIGAKLTSIKKKNYFQIIDERDRIGQNATSKTLVPELIVDDKTDTAIYDCPGFLDNRNIEHEMTITYFLKKLMNHVNSIKFMFSVNYASVQNTGNKNDFKYLLKQLNTFIKNITKFHAGIAMVVTKVDNNWDVDDNGVGHLANNDTETLGDIVNYLTEVKLELEMNLLENRKILTNNYYENAIKFIEILLEKQNNSYTRIAIFRKPYRSGVLNEMASIKKEIHTIYTILNYNLQYVKKENDDFGFSVSSETINTIRKMVDRLVENRLKLHVSSIGNEIRTHYLQQEKKSHDIDVLRENISDAYRLLKTIDDSNPFKFFHKYINATNILRIPLSSNNVNALSNDIDVLDFLTTVNNDHIPNAIHLKNELNENIKSIESSSVWYTFLNNIYEKLSEYDAQKMKIDLRTRNIIEQCSILTDERRVSDTNLKEFLTAFGIQLIYNNIADLMVNAYELKDLKSILIAFTSNAYTSCTNDELIVNGYNLKLSDVMNIECWQNAKYIRIMALNRIYIDASLIKMGIEAQVSIIAPAWEINGSQMIILNGAPAENHNKSSARNGVGHSENGGDGLPGMVGGLAGHFLGIGRQFIGAENLEIHANGGDGGAGQNGGNGMKNG